MKSVLGPLAILALIALPAAAKEAKNNIKEKGKVADAATIKAEVKTSSTANDPKRTRKTAPAAKATGAKKRSGSNTCDVHIDNRTDLKIQIFIDGDFEGMMTPYGDAVRYDVLNGTTKLFAKADFSDGSTQTWGPRYFDCSAYSSYTWTLSSDG